MQSVAVASAEHNSAREFVNDKHLTVLHDIVHITLHNAVCLKRLSQMVHKRHIFRVHKVVKIEIAFRLGNTRFCKGCRPALFVYKVVAVLNNIVGFGLCVKLLDNGLFQTFYKSVRRLVQIGGFFADTGNNERSSRLVYKD